MAQYTHIYIHSSNCKCYGKQLFTFTPIYACNHIVYMPTQIYVVASYILQVIHVDITQSLSITTYDCHYNKLQTVASNFGNLITLVYSLYVSCICVILHHSVTYSYLFVIMHAYANICMYLLHSYSIYYMCYSYASGSAKTLYVSVQILNLALVLVTPQNLLIS